MAFLATAAPILGTLLSAGGTVISGMQQAEAARYQAKVAEINQEVAERNAAQAVQRGQIEAQDQDFRTAAALGSLTAQQAASGLNIGSGSLVRTRQTARTLGRQDALRLAHAGQVEGNQFRTQATNFGNQAASLRAQADSLVTSGIIGGARSLIGGATSIRPGTFNRITSSSRDYVPIPRPRPVGLIT